MKTLIKNSTVLLPEGAVEVDVLIEADKIVDIDPAKQIDADEVVDASGLHLLPGVIDDQVHFREPGLTHKEDLAFASRACAKGGVTTFLEMPNTSPATISQDALLAKLALAQSKSLVNYGFYIGATTKNCDALTHATRTPGIKIFIGSSTGDLLVDEQEALENIFSHVSLPICAHCEDETTIRANRERIGESVTIADHSRIRDHQAAIIATRRAVDLASRHGKRFHVLHVSTAEEATYLASLQGKERALITAEVCPHHLFFNEADYARLGSLVQMNPSVKTKEDNAALWQALDSGGIQIIATDHAPHTLEEKKQPYPQSPSGVPAVENSLALLLNQVNGGRCTLEQVVQWMCEGPALVWDIVDKGRIAVGYDADLVLVDMNQIKTIQNEEQLTKSKWSPWHGESLQGWPVRTWVMGQELYREGQLDESVRGKEAIYDHARGGYWKAL